MEVAKPKTAMIYDIVDKTQALANIAAHPLLSAKKKTKAIRKVQNTLAMRSARGNNDKNVKILSMLSRDSLAGQMKPFGDARAQIIKQFGSQGHVAVDRKIAEEQWRAFLEQHAEAKPFFGLDPEGLAKRQRLSEQGFTVSGGAGKFRPFSVIGGVLRGGLTAKGQNLGSTYAIPVQPKGDSRILTSLTARYTNPLLFPATRIIKFIRGHWGQGNGVNKFESVW